jgi:uncharacterized protein YdhG (YjbR/CyaY superfamily)
MPTKQSAKTGSNARKPAKLWSDVERAAAQETARERKRQSRRRPEDERAQGELEVRAKIAEMPPAERSMAERIHAIVAASAPELVPRTFYGMPAYAKNGKVLCFFQAASKFKVRYSTFGFQPAASLDEGDIWPIAFALTKLTSADEARIAALVKKAVS